nr:hypothetical protein [Tanacetum cinerariifolium]
KPEIPKSDFDFEEEIRPIENLMYDDSFPRPPEELNAEIADTIIESIPLLHIPEEIDIVTKTDDVLPPSDENDDDLSDDLLLGEADLFLDDNQIPLGKDISAVVNKDASDDENDDYCSLMFVIQFFLPYLILPEISSLRVRTRFLIL